MSNDGNRLMYKSKEQNLQLYAVLGIDHQMAIDDLDLDPTKFLIEMIEIDRDSFLIELIESISISINFQKQFISGLLHNVKNRLIIQGIKR